MASSFGPLTLGELIGSLERTNSNPLPGYCEGMKNGERQVYFDWCSMRPSRLHSYRGYYNHLAIGVAEYDRTIRVNELIACLKGAVGETYQGWKGGDYTMGEQTPVWVSEPGQASRFGIIGVRDDGYQVTLLTERFDD